MNVSGKRNNISAIPAVTRTLPELSGELSLLSEWMNGVRKSLPDWRRAVPELKLDAPTYPGGSKSRVTKAGAAVRDGTATADDLACIDMWRAAHAPVINTFQALLRARAKRSSCIVGQRHKRKLTIFGKLQRLPRMELARMDDIAGCRLIFKSIDALNAFRTKLHTAKFKHKMRNSPEKYDYISSPKSSGYRGIHDIYEYNVTSEVGAPLKGLFIELQYRTEVQHAWATAVEIIGVITDTQPKFQ